MYKSPIDIIYGQLETQLEGEILKAIYQYEILVDKEELLRALQYDRQQYKKGYADGKADAMDDLVRCKDCKHARINENHPNKPLICYMTKMCGTTKPDWFCAEGERREGE